MKNIYAIKIAGSDSRYLSVTLKEILNCLTEGSKLNWSLLWISATGDLGQDISMLQYESDVNDSQNGRLISWAELDVLSVKVEQVIEMELIGSKFTNRLKRYDKHDTMYNECDYTIELVDSSYWIVHCHDEVSLHCFQKLPGASLL